MELFYYTSTNTMRYVLTEKNIYATNIRYMNDSEEYINGLKELQELSKKEDVIKGWIKKRNCEKNLAKIMKDTFSKDNLQENEKNMEYYSISFCKKNDLLSQWAIYAKESGVSIKMNFEETPYIFFTKCIGGHDAERAEWKLLPQEVYYFTEASMGDKPDEYKATAYKILDQLYEKNPMDHEEGMQERWRYISTFVKRYDFYQEEECRLVFEPNESVYLPQVEYRHDKKVLKPYLDIKCDHGWPIWEIMIGPGFNQQVVFDSVEHFLNHAEVKVGIRTTRDYVERIKKYLEQVASVLEECKEYKELSRQFSDTEWINRVEMEDAKIFFNQKMDGISKAVCENDTYSRHVKEYFSMQHFTRSGVVIKKSSIPYIF